ncbi:hypothetical protein EUBDOL_01758 [Amedibacillus dolichus DSM 3991]|uniref:Uncharacterized protein n=1 Tax=Amedibacillus dolichus DSM 3991 TaxID=428127 RepID=A8RED5_9FIRM|nr:hypothetical protein EUBDOL_01758 [Amedibacillus dolichus DSM 3991]
MQDLNTLGFDSFFYFVLNLTISLEKRNNKFYYFL